MSNEQNNTIGWKYFGRDSMGPRIYEIYRCPNNGEAIEYQRPEDVQLLARDGTWIPGMQLVLTDEIYSGKFDEKLNALSDDEAKTLMGKWLAGEWPGRK